jgi:diguanylate cyclase
LQLKDSLHFTNEKERKVIQMLSNLFINAAILISFIFLSSQLYKDGNKVHTTLTGNLFTGLFGGLLGTILIFYGIKVHNETLVDFRFIPIVLLAFYTTPFSTLIASLIISASRIIFYGINNSSILGACATIIIAVGCILLMKLKIKIKFRFWYMFFYSLLIVLVALAILFENKAGSGIVLATYSLIYTTTGLIVYRLSEYVINSNELYYKFREQASKDFLTGLNNVRQYDTIINEAYKRVRDYGERLSILALDIDHFKKVNDTYGHDGGDAVLRQLGNVLLSSCRPFDIVARVGGEEFSVVLLDCPNSQAVEVAERIRNSVGEYAFILPDGTSLQISISIGVATYPDSTENLEELKKQADIELYKAKETGRNKVCSYLIKDCGDL